MYTMIPPVRSDFDRTRLFSRTPTDKPTGNYIVLTNSNSKLHLQEYKTAKTYKELVIDLPSNLVHEIYLSLQKMPRKYLFVSPRTKKEFENQSTFNTWANRALKKITGKKTFSLNMLRHIYISRRDLKMETKSGLDQEKIAKLMGHSISTQKKYNWHSFLDE